MSVRTPVIAALLIGGLALVGAVGIAAAAPAGSGLILYRSPFPAGLDATVVHLWTTDGKGQNAREILRIKPTGRSDVLRGAYLVPDGVILATTDANDGNNTDIEFLKRGSPKVQRLFTVRGLGWFQPSPDGQMIAYSRQLPVAGKPLFVIARRDGTIVRALAHMSLAIFGWSSDSQQVFSYCPTVRRRELCAYEASTGTHRATGLMLELAASAPSVSPAGARVAFWAKLGPAGERIYSPKGAFLRNLVGQSGAVVWSPDDSQMVLQPYVGLPSAFSFKTKRLTTFAHKGPANLFVLDWR